jgi:hypothetical protein
MYSLCVSVTESHDTVNYTKHSVLHKNVSILNLCHQEQCKLYVPVFKEIIFQTN